jgi:GntR family transcriptional regulator
LGIRKGAPVLHIYRVTFQAEGRPFEYTESYYRGDRYIFNVELTNNMHIEGSNREQA